MGRGSVSFSRCGAIHTLVLVLAALLPLSARGGVDHDFMSLSLEELLSVDIGVASRVSHRADRQPVSVTLIGRDLIRMSGARTLNELLMLHVPGYFLVEDQDDTIAGMRGLAPDNNSKILLLLDGRNLNAEWFWGPPDALLNGLDLEFIERIEVIRGPGSVTQGQGALLGVINIVTRSADESGQAIALHGGQDGRGGGSWHWRRQYAEDRSARLYLSDGQFDGEPIREEGLARQFEQGLTVFERNHHLKRGTYRHLLADYASGGLALRGYRFEQRRDLYNWRRDREQVRQVLGGVQAAYERELGRGQLTVDGHGQVDDYFLRSHGGTRPEAGRQLVAGLTMGGHRETRSGMRALWTADGWLERHRLALGAEFNHYRSGLANADGNNFLVNSQDEVLTRGRAVLNAGNRWSLPGSTSIRSVFAEDFIALGTRWELFAAARWDSHPRWGSEVTPRLGLFWQQSPHSQWRVAWQSGFRGAVGVHYSGGFEGDGLLREQNFDAVEANPFFAANGDRNLRPVEPEKLASVELAWRYQRERVQFNAVSFYNVLRNVIGVGAYFIDDPAERAAAVAARTMVGSDVIGDWGGVFYFQNNDGELHHRGVELEVEYRHEESGLLARLSHSAVSVAKADAGQFGPGNIYVTGTPAQPGSRSFPENVSRMYLSLVPPALQGRWRASYTHLHYSRWMPPARLGADGQPFAPKLDGDQIGHLAIGWHSAHRAGLSLTLQIKNLWNAGGLWPTASVAGEGASNDGVPALERRSAWLSLRHRF
jgi:outer membrane receptor protein involved in Fe transport